MLVLHRAKLLASNQSVLALGVAPSGVRAAAPHSARHGRRACMPKGSARCRANKANTDFHRGKGFGDRDNKSEVYFKNRLFLQSATPRLHKQSGENIKCDDYLYLPFWIFFINCRFDISPVLTFQESSCSSFQLL